MDMPQYKISCDLDGRTRSSGEGEVCPEDTRHPEGFRQMPACLEKIGCARSPKGHNVSATPMPCRAHVGCQNK